MSISFDKVDGRHPLRGTVDQNVTAAEFGELIDALNEYLYPIHYATSWTPLDVDNEFEYDSAVYEIPGAEMGDFVLVKFSEGSTYLPGMIVTGQVTDDDEVTVYMFNGNRNGDFTFVSGGGVLNIHVWKKST